MCVCVCVCISVQSADMHVSALYASSVQLGTHPHMNISIIEY